MGLSFNAIIIEDVSSPIHSFTMLVHFGMPEKLEMELQSLLSYVIYVCLYVSIHLYVCVCSHKICAYDLIWSASWVNKGNV